MPGNAENNSSQPGSIEPYPTPTAPHPTTKTQQARANDESNLTYIDPLYSYSLILPKDWYASSPPLLNDILYGVSIFINYNPDELSDHKVQPEGGLKIQIGIGKLRVGYSLNDWILERIAEETTSEAVKEFGYISSEPEIIQIDGNSRSVFMFAAKDKPHILEINLLTDDQITSIGVTPADSPYIEEALQIISSLDLNSQGYSVGNLLTAPIDLNSHFQNLNTLFTNFPNYPTDTCPSGTTYSGDEAPDTPIELWMPFSSGETWQVGGSGAFYGNYLHCNSHDDYYATDWNRSGDDGAVLLPVANGNIVYVQKPPCPNDGWGCQIHIEHSSGIKTVYAHLSAVTRESG